MGVRFEENAKEIIAYIYKPFATNEFLKVLLRKMWNEAVEIGMNREHENQKSGGTSKANQ